MLTAREKDLIQITILTSALEAMNKELTAMLAIIRGERAKTACACCEDEVDSQEIQEFDGYCEYCATANDRAEHYRERKHPDEK